LPAFVIKKGGICMDKNYVICPVCASREAYKIRLANKKPAICCDSCGEIVTLQELEELYKKSGVRSTIEIAAYNLLRRRA
jgi:hypothetical protein